MKFLYLVIILLLTSCSSNRTWVIKRWQNGGIVGFSGDTHDIYSSVKKKVHCPYFKIVSHFYKSQNSKIDKYYDFYNPEYTVNTHEYYRRAKINNASDSPKISSAHWKEVIYKCSYHPYYDYHRNIHALSSNYSYYNPPINDSELPNCHGYYDYGCKLDEY